MPNIPTVPGSEIDVATPSQAVRMDAGAFTGPQLRGAAAMAGAAESIGSFAQDVQEDIMKARNASIAADVDLKMRTARQTFIESLRNDPNEQEWTARAKETADQVRADVIDTHGRIPPMMRGQVDSAFKAWQSSLLIETGTLANVQTVNKAWGKTKEDYTEKLRDGDAEGAMASLRLARDTKIAPPEELDQLERDIPKTIALNFIENGLQNNPKGTTELLKSGGSLPALDQNGKAIVPAKVLTPRQMEQLINSGRVRTAAWQKGNFEAMLADSSDPVTGYVPEEVIKQKMAAGEIDQIAGRNKMAAQDRRMKAEAAAAATQLKKDDTNKLNLIRAGARDTTSWGTQPELRAHELIADAADISDPLLQKQAVNSVNEHLAAVKKTGEALERPVEQQIYKLMNEDKETNGAMLPVGVEDVETVPARGGVLGFGKRAAAVAATRYVPVAGGLSAVKKMTDDEIKVTYGPDATKDSVISEINVHAARVQEEMRAWFKTPQGQKATFDEANAHRQEVESPYVMDAVRGTLAKKAPTPVATQEEYDALPIGAKFIWNGRIGIKNR